MKQKNFIRLWLLLIPVLIAACTCNVSTKLDPEKPNPTGGRVQVADTSVTLTGYFSIVNCQASDFAKLASTQGNGKRRNALFIKYQIASTGLNLVGWQFKRIQQQPVKFGFSNNPDLLFSQAGQSSLAYTPGISLGDLILSNQDVHTIKAAITANPAYTYLVFTPVTFGTGNTFTGYALSLSNSPTGLKKDFSDDGQQVVFNNIPLNVRSNPIPPGGGDILDVQ